MQVPPGTIVIWSDIACPWAHTAVYRLLEARRRLELDAEVVLEHLAYPLELFDERGTDMRLLEAEIPVLAGAEPGAGWQRWAGQDWEWPVTTLPALEAVRAAHLQGAAAAERLDRALRLAFFGQSRRISLRHVIIEVARECEGLDVDSLIEAIDDGTARRRVIDESRLAAASSVLGSPHLFLPDGTDVHNPGLRVSWIGSEESGYPVIEENDPSVFEDLLRRSAGEAA